MSVFRQALYRTDLALVSSRVKATSVENPLSSQLDDGSRSSESVIHSPLADFTEGFQLDSLIG